MLFLPTFGLTVLTLFLTDFTVALSSFTLVVSIDFLCKGASSFALQSELNHSCLGFLCGEVANPDLANDGCRLLPSCWCLFVEISTLFSETLSSMRSLLTLYVLLSSKPVVELLRQRGRDLNLGRTEPPSLFVKRPNDTFSHWLFAELDLEFVLAALGLMALVPPSVREEICPSDRVKLRVVLSNCWPMALLALFVFIVEGLHFSVFLRLHAHVRLVFRVVLRIVVG